MGLLLSLKTGAAASSVPSGTGMPAIKTGLVPHAFWDSVQDDRGYAYMVNGIDRPQVYNGRDSGTRNWGIIPPTAAPTGAESGTSGLTGSYFYHVAYVNKNIAPELISNPSPVSDQVSLSSAAGRINFSATGFDTQVTHRRIYRNTDGQAFVWYKVADVSATVNTYLDTSTDTAISTNEVLDFDHDVPTSQAPFVEEHQQRVHLFGSRVENTGTIEVAGTAITGTGTSFRASHVGQTLTITGQRGHHIVSSVASGTGLVLATSATNGSGLSFQITPEGTRAYWWWSKASEPEYFPVLNAVPVGAGDGDFPTGMFVLGSILYGTKRNRIYRLVFQADPNPVTGDGGIFPASERRGSVNNRTIVVVGGTSFILDEQGIYEFDGSGATPIDRAINRLIQPSNEPDADRVNWSAKEYFHANIDFKHNKLMFFVALGSDSLPKHALCYDLDDGTWHIDEFPMAITCSSKGRDSNERERLWLGDENGLIWAYGVSSGIDGAPDSSAGTLEGTATGGTTTSLTDSGASFYSSGDALIGVPVYIKNGGTSSFSIISSNTGTALTLAVALGEEVASGATYKIGAIDARLRTKWFPAGEPGLTKRAETLRIICQPYATSVLCRIRIFTDFSTSPFTAYVAKSRKDGREIPVTAKTDGVIYAYLNKENGVIDIPIGKMNFNHIQFEIRVIETGKKVEILGYEFRAPQVPGSEQL